MMRAAGTEENEGALGGAWLGKRARRKIGQQSMDIYLVRTMKEFETESRLTSI